MPLLDTGRHRRVHSEFAPSPLGAGASFARALEEDEAERGSPDSSNETEGFATSIGSGAGTSALASRSAAGRRKGRRAAASDEEDAATGAAPTPDMEERKTAVDAMDMDD